MNNKNDPYEMSADILFTADETVCAIQAKNVGKARRAPNDAPDPIVGGFLALARAMGVDVVEACMATLEAVCRSKERKRGEKVKVPVHKKTEAQTPDVGTPLGKLTKEQLLHVEIQGPHGEGEPFGWPGTPTEYKDSRGNALYVGDVVTVDIKRGGKWDCSQPLSLVVDGEGGQYIFGVLDWCDVVRGTIDKRARVTRVKSWQEVELGDKFVGKADGGLTVAWTK